MVSRDKFVNVWNEVNSPSRVAKELNLDLRSVYRRRRRLESEGYVLPTHTPGSNIRHAYKLETHIAVDDAIAIIVSDRHKWPNDGITPIESVLHQIIKYIKPDIFVFNGDLFDGAALSNHAPLGWEQKPSVYDELTGCQDVLSNIEVLLKPECIKIRTVGNHCRRFDYRLAKVAPEYADIPGTRLADYFPTWDEAWSVVINKGVIGGHTVIKHRFKGGAGAARSNALAAGVSIVTGHTHALSCSAVEDYNGRRWGVECGYLAYREHPAFEYTENSPFNARPGFAVLTWRDGILTPPELVELDDSGTSWFRGEPVFSEKPRIRVKLTKS